MRPVVIAVAITGSVPRKKDNPALPVTVDEQIAATRLAFEAGASLVHLHVRNADESASSDPALFGAVMAGIRCQCPGMIVQFSTGGRGRDARQRGAALALAPDMASLSTGSVNFPDMVYENPPALVDSLALAMQAAGVRPEIEIFDLSHLYGARRLIDAGLAKEDLHVQFVLGVKNALPASATILDLLLGELRRVLPRATWTAAGTGRHQTEVIDWALERGAAVVRTGMEDNIRSARDRLVSGNAELVALAVARCAAWGARPASVGEARQLLGITPEMLKKSDKNANLCKKTG